MGCRVTDNPYRIGKKSFTQHAYRDGWIVWNWDLNKLDYFNEKIEVVR